MGSFPSQLAVSVNVCAPVVLTFWLPKLKLPVFQVEARVRGRRGHSQACAGEQSHEESSRSPSCHHSDSLPTRKLSAVSPPVAQP